MRAHIGSESAPSTGRRRGGSSSGEAGVAVDGHGPLVAFAALMNIAASRGIVARVSDQFSGVRSASLMIDRRVVARLGHGATSITYRPPGGWSSGRSYAIR